jgi:hypothetical protein
LGENRQNIQAARELDAWRSKERLAEHKPCHEAASRRYRAEKSTGHDNK